MGHQAVGLFSANRKIPMVEVIRHSPELMELRIPYTSSKTQFNFFLASDIHLDNPKCKRKLFAKHLNEMQEKGGKALFFGDLLCLMQGKKDRRSDKSSIRPEHLAGNYFDVVFEEAAEFLKPWAKDIVMIGDGNHETAIINHNEVNPLRHVSRMLQAYGSKCQHMGYQGFIWFTFYQKGGDDAHPKQEKVRRLTLAFHHGAWGGVVSKGINGGMRYFSIFPSANIVVNGHNHERTIVEHPCHSVMNTGEVFTDVRYHCQLGTYKEEFRGGGGFAVEKIVMPKAIGGLVMSLRPRLSSGVEIVLQPAV